MRDHEIWTGRFNAAIAAGKVSDDWGKLGALLHDADVMSIVSAPDTSTPGNTDDTFSALLNAIESQEFAMATNSWKVVFDLQTSWLDPDQGRKEKLLVALSSIYDRVTSGRLSLEIADLLGIRYADEAPASDASPLRAFEKFVALPNPELRSAAAEGLLSLAVFTPHADVRMRAASLLARLLSDSSPAVREQAIRATDILKKRGLLP